MAALQLVPCCVLLLECLCATLPLSQGKARAARSGHRPRVAVLVPAHDEASIIAGTVTALRRELEQGDRLLVVAHNCTDATADLARSAGAEVVERGHLGNRGKGFALAYGFEALAEAPPEVVVILDADCVILEGGVGELAARALGAGRPVQARYLLSSPADGTPACRVSAFAVMVRNRVRPLGLSRLGLPCQLTGSGMALPWSIARNAANTRGDLVEDLALTIDLAHASHAPVYVDEVQVRAVLPCAPASAFQQRQRWESGQLRALVFRAPRLLQQGIRLRDRGAVALALDSLVPPLALFSSLLVIESLLSWALAAAGEPLAARLIFAECLVVLVALSLAYYRYGRDVLAPRDLLAIPGYLLSKLPIYAHFLFGSETPVWSKTPREHAQAAPNVRKETRHVPDSTH